MKTEDTIMATKGFCEVVVGFTATLVAGLAQWATGGDSPSRIAWIVIMSAAVGSAAGKLSSFLSTSFGNYISNKTNGNETPPATTTNPSTFTKL
jgi:hypothetical protein